jgi:hypothetical protein
MADQKFSALDKVTLSQIVDRVLNEESYSSCDDSDVSSDNDTPPAESEEDNEIHTAVQMVPVKNVKVPQSKHISERKWAENQNISIIHPFNALSGVLKKL